jgi:hypothetical protein
MSSYFRNSFIFMLLIALCILSIILTGWIVSLSIPLLVFLIPVIFFLLLAIGPMLLDFIE